MFKIVKEFNPVEMVIKKKVDYYKIRLRFPSIPLSKIQRIFSVQDSCYITSDLVQYKLPEIKLPHLLTSIFNKKDIQVSYRFEMIEFYCHRCNGTGSIDWVKTLKPDTDICDKEDIPVSHSNTFSLFYNSTFDYGCNILAIKDLRYGCTTSCNHCFGSGLEPNKQIGRHVLSKIKLERIYDEFVKGKNRC